MSTISFRIRSSALSRSCVLRPKRSEAPAKFRICGTSRVGAKHGRMTVPDQFVRANTVLTASSLVPEVRLHLATEILPLWNKTEDEIEKNGLPPPYWAFAWAGGQALARYVLDTPETVRGKRVLDFGSGSGLVAIAAAKAGASSILAVDIDAFAVAAITLNARANGVEIDVRQKDILEYNCVWDT